MQTAEGTKLQLISKVDKTQAVVVSTLMEAWEVVSAGLVADSTVKDVSIKDLGEIIEISMSDMPTDLVWPPRCS